MPARALARTLLLAALAGLSGCDSLTGADLRDGQMAGVWAHRSFDGSATALVHDEHIHLFGEMSLPGLGRRGPAISVDGGKFFGPGTYDLADATVWYMLSYDEVGATYGAAAGGKLVIEEVNDGTISGGVWFTARSAGETPVGSHGRFYARFESVPLEYRP